MWPDCASKYDQNNEQRQRWTVNLVGRRVERVRWCVDHVSSGVCWNSGCVVCSVWQREVGRRQCRLLLLVVVDVWRQTSCVARRNRWTIEKTLQPNTSPTTQYTPACLNIILYLHPPASGVTSVSVDHFGHTCSYCQSVKLSDIKLAGSDLKH